MLPAYRPGTPRTRGPLESAVVDIQVQKNTQRPPVALESTLLVHGVPPSAAPDLAADLLADVEGAGAEGLTVAVFGGKPIAGLDAEQLGAMLGADPGSIPKLNTSTLGLAIRAGATGHGATTVSATMEIAAAAGIRVFATGGIGGVHKGYGARLDVSADLAALARVPVAVVASGVKSILDIEATREALETLGVPVIGYRTDRFPAFYTRESNASVDARIDDDAEIGAFVAGELRRTGRGVLIVNPIPEADELDPEQLDRWIADAEEQAQWEGVSGRDVTPFVLADLHQRSGGATLRANLALVRSNARLAGAIAAAMPTAPGER